MTEPKHAQLTEVARGRERVLARWRVLATPWRELKDVPKREPVMP